MTARLHRLTRRIDEQLVNEAFDAHLQWRFGSAEHAARLVSRLVP